MKTAMPLMLVLAGWLLPAGTLAAAESVVVQRWTVQGYAKPISIAGEDFGREIGENGLGIMVTSRQVGGVTEWQAAIVNRSTDVARLRIRITGELPALGGEFWDGYEVYNDLQESISPITRRYVFPGIAYIHSRRLLGIGYAPDTVSSRFERSCRVADGSAELIFDSYLALHPQQRDRVTFIRYASEDADDYTELVEAIYCAYPRWSRPVAGAD